jgi:hypothetical protein
LGGRYCANCGRPIKTYNGRDEHRRGRIAGISPFRRGQVTVRDAGARRSGHDVAARLRAVDIDGDVCECGAPADPRLHPPLAKPGPLNPWKANRVSFDGITADGSPFETPARAAAARARQARSAQREQRGQEQVPA